MKHLSIEDQTVTFNGTIIELATLPPSQASLIARTARDLDNASESLEKALDSLRHTLTFAAREVESGRAVNSLGVVQGQGSEIDRLCGVREAHAETLNALISFIQDSK